MKLSIIVPVCNEQGNIHVLYNKILDLLGDLPFEIIYVNDGSIDKTEKEISELYEKDCLRVRAINFSRNFGKEAAMYAGLEHAKGEYTAIIDGDMEHPPKYLVKMLEFLESNDNYDQVAMVIKKRKAGSVFKRTLSKLFYKIISALSDTEFHEGAGDYRLFRTNVKKAILGMKEKNRFSKGIFSWIGFNTKYMEFDVDKRTHGETKFNLITSFKYALDGIIGYSVKPLKISSFLGFLCTISGFTYLLYVVIKTIVLGPDTPGFATIVSLILFIGGLQLLSIGILGEYLSRTFIESKNRPIYVEKSKLGFEETIL